MLSFLEEETEAQDSSFPVLRLVGKKMAFSHDAVVTKNDKCTYGEKRVRQCGEPDYDHNMPLQATDLAEGKH